MHGGYAVLKKPLYILAPESIAQWKKEGVLCQQGCLLGRNWALTSRILVPQSDECDSCTNNLMLVCIQGLVVHDILKAEKEEPVIHNSARVTTVRHSDPVHPDSMATVLKIPRWLSDNGRSLEGQLFSCFQVFLKRILKFLRLLPQGNSEKCAETTLATPVKARGINITGLASIYVHYAMQILLRKSISETIWKSKY